jgi:hypothetical protein
MGAGLVAALAAALASPGPAEARGSGGGWPSAVLSAWIRIREGYRSTPGLQTRQRGTISTRPGQVYARESPGTGSMTYWL